MHRFTQVDVFSAPGADGPELTSGNPVAVVHDADDLTDQQMADFARWTNLSETTFLGEPTDARADYRLRIFTTSRELPFAGHPTLGSAHAWLQAGGVPRHPDAVVQECGAGLVRIRRDGRRLAFAAPSLVRGGDVAADDLAELARSLGLGPEAVVGAQWADNGPGWVALLLNDAEAVLAIDPRGLTGGRFSDVGVVGPYPPGSEVQFEVRAFVAAAGHTGEDPVTGSLNAALGQWLIGSGRAPRSYMASQGTALGRRGRVHVSQVGSDVWVGGATVTGVSGTVHLSGIGSSPAHTH